MLRMDLLQAQMLSALAEAKTQIQAHPWVAASYALFLFVLYEYWKVLPLVYHLRTIATMIQGFLSPGLKSPADPVKSHHTVRLCDRDWNGHQNNSCYNLEIDIVRYLWIIRFMKHNPKWRSWFNKQGVKLANGGVSMYFLKEIRYGQSYDIITKLSHADGKWFYVQTDFVQPVRHKATHSSGSHHHEHRAGKQHHPTVYATGVSRMVFKARSGKTIPPSEVLEALGYGPAEQWRVRPAPGPQAASGGPQLMHEGFWLDDKDGQVYGTSATVDTTTAAQHGSSSSSPAIDLPWPGLGMGLLLDSLSVRLSGSLPVSAHAAKARAEAHLHKDAPQGKSKAS